LLIRAPALNRRTGPGQTETLSIPSLRDANVEHRTDFAECLVDIDRQSVHSDDGGEGNQRDDQSVFHKALTGFILVERLED